MDEEENGAPSEELRNRALALQLQLSLGEQAEEATAPDPYEGLEDRRPSVVRKFDEFLAANIPGAQAAGEFAAETLDTLVLDYLPKDWKNKLAEYGVGFPKGAGMEGKGGAAARALGMGLPFIAGVPAAGQQLARQAALTASGARLSTPGREILTEIGETAARNPAAFLGIESAAAAAAGAAGEGVRTSESISPEYRPFVQVGTEILVGGGVGALPVVIPKSHRALVDAIKTNLFPMTREGSGIRAARQMQERAGGAERAAELADLLDDIPEGVTPAQWLGDTVLMSQQARLVADNPDLANQIAVDLLQARRAAQQELADAQGVPRTRQQWEQSVIQRVTPEGVTIQQGQTDEMLKQAFDSFDPLYEPTKGFLVDLTPGQLKPKRGQPALSQQAENILGATDNQNIMATRESREAVRDWIQNQLTKYPGIRVFKPNAANVTKTDDLLQLRSDIRGEQRTQRQAGNLERADLLGSAEAELTQVIDDALPRDLRLQLRETDGLYRQYKVIETAVYNTGDNVLSPNMVSEAIRTGNLTTPGRYARGESPVVEQLRTLSRAGQDPFGQTGYAGNPERAALIVRDLSPEERKSVHATFIEGLINRAKPSAAEVADGVVMVSGENLTQDLIKNIDTMKALGMTDVEINRVKDIARRIRVMEEKSPAAVANLFDDGPSTIMELLAAVIGAKQGSNIASTANIGQSLVLAQFFSNRARNFLRFMTADKATQLLRDAAMDPKLYQELLRKQVTSPRQGRERARYVESYILTAPDAFYEELVEQIPTPTEEEVEVTLPPQARVAPPAPQTRGVPGMGAETAAPAPEAAAPTGPVSPSSREMLQQLFPTDFIA
jgi:hypothetical protein